jgi:excisionase family DNA binding protein
MGIQEVADLLGVSKKKIWQAVKDGTLPAQKIKKGNAWRYLIEAADVEAYRAIMDEPSGWELVPQRAGNVSETPQNDGESAGNGNAPRETLRNGPETASNPPVELYLALVDRLQRAERRTVELELALQQSQRLLCENVESITEREARAKQAESREQELAVENARLSVELEEAQKPKGFLSWLGLRKKRTAGAPVDKAV